jgi:hypothetical protein
MQGGLTDLWNGVLGRSLVRLHVRATIVPLPPIREWIGVLPIALVLLACVAWRKMHGRAAIVVVSLTLLVAALLGFNDPIYQSAWNTARAMTPLLTLAVCWLLGSEKAVDEITPARRRQLFLLTSAAAMVSLVQVPFAHAIYFFYAAPLVILAGLFYFSNQPRAPRKVGAMLGAAFGVFAFLWLNGAFSPGYGHQFVAYEPAHMEIDRCRSLEVDPLSASVYEGLVEVIDQVTPPGSYIYAAPDCPEVYFFTNRRNPTRTFFDLMDEDFGRPERVARILSRLEECNVDAVVLRPKGSISGFLPRRLHRELVKRYPNAFRIALESTDDVHFVVRWRDPNDERIATHPSRSSGVEGVP